LTDNPPRAPAGAVAAPANPGADAAPALHAAPLLRRLAAVTYEAILLCAVLLLAGFLLAPAVSPAPAGSFQRLLPIPSFPARVLSFAATFGVGALYFGWSWTGGRRTLPMKTWRVRVVSRAGGAVMPRTALVRYCAAWIGPGLALLAYAAMAPAGYARGTLWLAALNYAWAFVDPERQFLHDRIAGTRIVMAPPTPSPAGGTSPPQGR
jgi:uncharacterized RDD family membrane protein YckC